VRLPTPCGNQSGRNCSCGLYATTDPVSFHKVLGDPGGDTDVIVCGVVGLGRVVIHQRGWRAEAARIVAIATETPARVILDTKGRILTVTRRKVRDLATLRAISKRYEAPMVSLQGMQDMLKEFSGGE
jgi:hypothetical protein